MADKYIKFEDAIREICKGCEGDATCTMPCRFAVGVAELPAADVVEVKRGKWVGIDDEPYEDFECKEFCPYCHEDADGHVFSIEKNCHAYWKYPNKLVVKFGKEQRECKINYCPMCGRRMCQ